jgi:hypothetical protein
VLAAAASRADAILHLAYIHDFSLDHSIVIDTEVNAVTALAKGARGKPIITTSGTALAAPAPDGGKITRGSHREPLGGCGDGKLGNLGRS